MMSQAADRRVATVERETKETQIRLTLCLDGQGTAELDTPVPFLNHMLHAWAHHGRFDLRLHARGDVEIDDHHTVEDIGICLGQAFLQALGDKRGIERYGQAWVPMDEALAQVVVDLSNRPHLEFHAAFPDRQVGRMPSELVHEFFWKFALESRITLHILLHAGRNTHHMVEAIFKACGRALREAVRRDAAFAAVPSTKGVL
jgi:imidazoleglycerol-phosphate dehydratase